MIKFFGRYKQACLLILFLVLWTSISIGIMTKGWVLTWKVAGVPAMSPVFADMRTVQGALISARFGFDPQVKNPGDPWHRVMNYPGIWFSIAKFFRFGNEKVFIGFICSYIIAYVVSTFFLLLDNASIYLFLAIFSGASLLAVERGNNDLLIFVMLFAAYRLSQQYWRTFLVILASVLKVFPAFSIFGLLKKPKLIMLSIVIIFGYMVINFNEMRLIQAGNTAGSYLAYGMKDLVWMTGELLWVIKITAPPLLLRGILIIFSLSVVILLANTTFRDLIDYPVGKDHRDLFMIGAAIFSCTYLLSNNWDYRLVFLFFCIPYLSTIKRKPIMHLVLICILISLNCLMVMKTGKYSLFFIIFIKYVLFLLITAFLIKEFQRYLCINWPELGRRLRLNPNMNEQAI